MVYPLVLAHSFIVLAVLLANALTNSHSLSQLWSFLNHLSVPLCFPYCDPFCQLIPILLKAVQFHSIVELNVFLWQTHDNVSMNLITHLEITIMLLFTGTPQTEKGPCHFAKVFKLVPLDTQFLSKPFTEYFLLHNCLSF